MQKRHFIGKPLILWPKKIDHYKTRLIEFGRFAETNRVAQKVGKPETFNFLGFTHLREENKRWKIYRPSQNDW